MPDVTERPAPETAHGGLQSLDAALHLLNVLAGQHGPVGLSDLARTTGMPISKVHRYLASFSLAGFVRQTTKSGKYDLGPAALRLGLAAVARHEFVNRAADHLPDLVADTGLTALLCVWGTYGPTVVRWERSAVHVVTALGLGSTLPLLKSATGRIFLAYAPEVVTASILDQELQCAASVDIEAMRAAVRMAGLASVTGDLIPGLAAVAAPVLDWQGEIQACVTLIGTDLTIAEHDSPAAAAVTKMCWQSSIPGL